MRAAIAAHGIRNALLTSIAPTGTISLFADNVSSGLEPVFSFSYTRNVLMPDGSRAQEEVDATTPIRLFHRLKGETAPLPDSFVDAQRLTPGDHVVMQAAVQKYIDSSISKTINCPADLAFEAFKDVYAQAYELGCKGCTTYRPNEITGAVLEAKPAAESGRAAAAGTAAGAAAAAAPARHVRGGRRRLHDPAARPARGAARPDLQAALAGERARASTSPSTTSCRTAGGGPFEIFINSKNMEHYAWTVASRA